MSSARMASGPIIWLRVIAKGNWDVPLFGGLAAEGDELIQGLWYGHAFLVEQRLVVVHADEIGRERHPIQRAVDCRGLDRWRRNSLCPAVLRRIVLKWQQETGVSQHAGVAGTGVIENDVRSGP